MAKRQNSRSPKSKAEQPRGYKREQIRRWLKDNPKGTLRQFRQATGIDAHSGQFSTCKAQLGIPLQPRRKRWEPEIVGAAFEEVSDKGSLPEDSVLLENAFLRWWNQGERQGYVDRLLKELQK